ncbi:MAG: O-antigen ligase family protein [Actinomycetota bacterium]
MTSRLRVQLEGAIQVAVVGLIVVIALVASHMQPWNFPAFHPMRAFALIELAALAVAYLVVTRARLSPLPGAAVTATFTLNALLSAAWSSNASVTTDRALGFAGLVLAAAALALGAVDRPRVAAQLMLALLAATTLIAILGLVELWRAYDQAVLPATKQQGARYNGIGQNPNQIPMLIALTLPFALWFLRESRGRLRAVALAVVLLLAGSLVASSSRGALVAAFAGCVVYLVAAVPHRWKAILAGGTALFLVAAALTQLPQPAAENPDLYPEFGRTPSLGPKDIYSQLPLESEFGFPGENVDPGKTRTLFSASGRLQAWESAVDQGLERPIAGFGFGTEDETFVDRSYGFVSDAVENSFIGVFLQLGALGVALLVAALALPLAAWWRVRPRLDPEAGEVAAACAGAVVAGVVLAVPQSYLTSVGSPPTAAFWISFFLLAALAVRSRSVAQA